MIQTLNHSSNFPRHYSTHGFSLIELAIVLMVIGLIVSGGVGFFANVEKRSKILAARDQLNTIQEALDIYVERAGVLPCPASFSARLGEAAFGRSTDCSDETVLAGQCAQDLSYCVQPGRMFEEYVPEEEDSLKSRLRNKQNNEKPMRVRVGAVPVRELNIPLEAMRDPWGNFITYAVTEFLTHSPTKFSQYDGGIGIVDTGGYSVVTPPETATYVLISHGGDRRGARPYNAGPLSVSDCPVGKTLDGANCGYTTQRAVYRVAQYATSTGKYHYDDHIAYKTQSTQLVRGYLECRDYPICSADNVNSVPVCRVRGGSEGMPLCVQRQDAGGGPDKDSPAEHDIASWRYACDFGDGWRKPSLAELRTLYERREDIGGFEDRATYLSRLAYNPALVGNDDRKTEIWALEFKGGSVDAGEDRINISPDEGDDTGRIRCVRR